MQRDILHLAVPAFPITVARVADRSLRERPVAVAPGHSERALVQCVSAEAQAEGVRAGMSIRRARQYCPALTVIMPDPAGVRRAERALLEVTGTYSPLREPGAPGHVFVDLSGGRRLFGPGRDTAMRLETELGSRLQLHGKIGLAGNKLVSRIAADYLDKPGVCDVLRGSESAFIAPLPVAALPGIGRIREQQLLEELNLRRVGELAALSVAQLRLVCGPFAALVHWRARGVDPSPVRPPGRNPQTVAETFLSREENDDGLLLAELCRLAEECGLDLRRRGRAARRLQLAVTYADGVAQQGASLLPVPQNHDLVLFEAAENLFHRICRRRVRVKEMRLVCDRFTAEERQLDLFGTDPPLAPRREALQGALDRVREKYGQEALRWGRTYPP